MSHPYTHTEEAIRDMRLLTDDDLHLFNEGTHYDLWKKLGAHEVDEQGVRGTNFAVWAPNAEQVSVIGDFNNWSKESHQLRPRDISGVWEGLVPDVGQGALYKYHIVAGGRRYEVDKADPFAFGQERSPGRASVVWNLG